VEERAGFESRNLQSAIRNSYTSFFLERLGHGADARVDFEPLIDVAQVGIDGV
jgi:hypothetical protein